MNTSSPAGESDLITSKETKFPEDWSRDGRYLISGKDNPTSSIRALQFGGPDLPLLSSPGSNYDEARLSFNGQRLAYTSDETGITEVYLTLFPNVGQKKNVSGGYGTQPRWRDDGRELYYLTSDGKMMAVDINADPEIESSSPHELFDTGLGRTAAENDQYAVTPNGDRFLILRRTEFTAPISVNVNWTAALQGQ
jgi:hypothetical protein